MIATYFPSYNTSYQGVAIETWADMLKKLQNPLKLDMNREKFLYLKDESPKTALRIKFRNGAYDCGECPTVKNPTTGEMCLSRAKGVPHPDRYGVIAIDADGEKGKGVTTLFDESINNILADYTFFSHATITSASDCRKRRIVIPLAEPVSINTRAAFVRYLARLVGQENIDPATTRNKQLMVFPVLLSDGDDYSYYNDKNNFLNVEAWLNENAPNWQDVRDWPRWGSDKDVKNEFALTRKRQRKEYPPEEFVPVQSDNRLRNAFNKTYKISELLEKSEKYVNEGGGRFSHTYDSSKCGIEVINDGIVRCYYAEDPLQQNCELDAFQVYIILKYGSIDDKANWARAYSVIANDERVTDTLRHELPVDLPDDADTWATIYDATEEGVAKRCMAFYPHRICNGAWMRYDNGIYTETKKEFMLPYAMDMVRIAAALQPDSDFFTKIIGQNTAGKNILSQWTGLAGCRQVSNADFETRPNLLHFTDGVLDLDAWVEGKKDFLLEHSPDYMMTQSTGYAWNDVEHCDSAVLQEITETLNFFLPDPDTRLYFLMAVGRALTTRAASEDICVWLLGEGGNGKSTILDCIKNAFGSYYYNLTAQVLYKNKNDNNGESPSPLLAGAENRRVVAFEEFSRSRTLNAEKYKNYTSGGHLQARKLYANAGSFTAKNICLIDTNGMPGVDIMDKAVKRRTRVIPFKVNVVEKDLTVKDRFGKDRRYAAAMMKILLEGYRYWCMRGGRLDTANLENNIVGDLPEAVAAETLGWFASFDDPAEFFTDYLVITNNEKDYIVNQEVYSTYCEQVSGKGMTSYQFYQELDRFLRKNDLGDKKKRDIGNGVRRQCYVGVKLVATSDGAFVNNGQWSYRRNGGYSNDYIKAV